MRTEGKYIYEKPKINEVHHSKIVNPIMSPPEYGSSKSWSGSCCFKDRASNEFSKIKIEK